MKNKSAIFLAAVMALSMAAFCGCESGAGSGSSGKEATQSAPFYSSASDVTIEKLIAHSTPKEMADYKGAFKQTVKYNGFGDANIDNAEFYTLYKKTGDKLEVNFVSKYSDGYASTVYLSNDKNDQYLYTANTMGMNKNEATDEEIKSVMEDTILGYDDFDAELISVTEEEGYYIASVKISQEGTEIGTDKLTIDPKSGFVIKVLSSQNQSGEEMTVESEFIYDGSLEIDATPKTEYKEPVEAQPDDSITTPAVSDEEPVANEESAADAPAETEAEIELKLEEVTDAVE